MSFRGVLVALTTALGILTWPAIGSAETQPQENELDALRAQASTPNGALAYGKALRRAGEDVQAIAALRRGLASGAMASSTSIALHYELSRAYLDKGELPPALAQCAAIAPIANGGHESHACAAEAQLLWKRGTLALQESELALAGGYKSYEAVIAEGRARELELHEDEAEAAYRLAMEWSPARNEAHLWLGRLFVRMGKNDMGVAELRKAHELDPRDPEAMYELAGALPPANEAADLLAHAIAERPSYAVAFKRLAEIEVTRGHAEAARKAAETAIKFDPKDYASHVIVGRLALDAGRADEALAAGRTALGILGNYAPGKLLVGDALAKKGDIDAAIEAFEQAWGLSHFEPTPLVHASIECRKAGRTTSARAFATKATMEFPAWGPAWVALGDAFTAEKDFPAAKDAYANALRAEGPVDAAGVNAKLSSLR
jgi:tetratricopeptide (TPR) repeat protein